MDEQQPSRRTSVSSASMASAAPPEVASIKVFCRLRQQNQLEKREGATQCSTVLDGRTMFLRDDKCDVDEIRCTFDRVFDTQSTQQEVYEHSAKPLVHEFLQGYNCTIFAYGQTGSGKTHTILGPKDGVLGKPEDEGIISRLVHDLFKSAEASTVASNTATTTIELSASFVEIYMEQIRDLLAVNSAAMPIGGLKIRENAQRGVYIEEMAQVACHTEAQMLDVVKTGTLNRSVSSTRMNKDSSRSHCILMVGVTRKSSRGTVMSKSMMYIVDLAGSEFVNKTNASGKVLQEAKAINKSLSALSNVIKALVEGKKHVPYRDSKLTRLLQDSLGGSAKTCLILAASCSSYNMPETISTLRFGLRAKEIKNPVALKSDGGASMGGGGIFKELYQQAMDDIGEKNKKIDELQHLLAQAYEANTSTSRQVFDPMGSSTCDGYDEGDVEQAEPGEGVTCVEEGGGDRVEEEGGRVSGEDEDEPTSRHQEPATVIAELEALNQRLGEENARLFTVLESLDNQLDQITIKTTPSGKPFLTLATPTSSSTEDTSSSLSTTTNSGSSSSTSGRISDHNVSFKMWIQSGSWRQLHALDTIDLDAEEQEQQQQQQQQLLPSLSTAETTVVSTALTNGGASPVKASVASCGSSTSGTDSGEVSPNCVHRVDAEAMSRLIVELKLQLHYLTESTKQSLDGEQYIIVLENAKLKTRIEELEFHANLGNVKCNQLEMKNRAWETRLSNQETHIACLQNSLQEYQGLFKQQIIMSQEKCRLLSDELEFYKKLSTRNGSVPGSPLAIDNTGSGDAGTTSSPQKSSSMRSPRGPGPGPSAAAATSPFNRLKAFGGFMKPLIGSAPAAEIATVAPLPGPATPLTVRAQRMIIKPSDGSSTSQALAGTSSNKSPWRRKAFDLSFTSSGAATIGLAISSRTTSSPELRTKLLLEDALFKD